MISGLILHLCNDNSILRGFLTANNSFNVIIVLCRGHIKFSLQLCFARQCHEVQVPFFSS